MRCDRDTAASARIPSLRRPSAPVADLRNEHPQRRCLSFIVAVVALCGLVGCDQYFSWTHSCIETPSADLRLAATDGNAEAQWSLGAFYLEAFRFGHSGRVRCTLTQSVRRHEAGDLAVTWVRRAADQGHPSAQSALGYLYFLGDILPADDAEAAIWWHRAADQGDPRAQNRLGEMYENGRGVPRDLVAAYVWYSLAESGSRDSVLSVLSTDTPAENRIRIAGSLTPGQLAETQDMLRER